VAGKMKRPADRPVRRGRGTPPDRVPFSVFIVDGSDLMAGAARASRTALRALLVAQVASMILCPPGNALAAATTAVAGAAKIDSLMKAVIILRRLGKYIAIGSIMFSGIMWMGGHRTQATERAIGTALGYLLLNHAADIIDLLDSI